MNAVLHTLRSFTELIIDLWPIVPFLRQWLFALFADCRTLLLLPVKLILQAEFGRAVNASVRQVLRIVFHHPLQLLLTIASLVLNAVASFINNVFKLSHDRSLNTQEIRYLQNVFSNNLDYAAIRIQTGGVKAYLKISPQAVCTDIFLRKLWGVRIVHDDRTLSDAGLRLLAHEACHVWQFQHTGAGYIGDSLMTQSLAMLGTRLSIRFSDGYELLPALQQGTECQQCNVEQQAVTAELIGAACAHHPTGQLTCSLFNQVARFNLGDTEFSTVHKAHAWFKGFTPVDSAEPPR